MTILIFEGADLSGKTTAISQYSKYHSDKTGLIIKNIYKPSMACDDTIWAEHEKILDMIKHQGHENLFILDRSYPSQAIYSILRGADEWHHYKHEELEESAREYDILYIFINVPFEEIKRRYKDRGDEHVNISRLKIIWERYILYFQKCNLNKIELDTREKDWMQKLDKFVFKNEDE